MAEANFGTNLLARMKAWPGFYAMLRALRRRSWQGVIEAARVLGIGIRFGAPKSFFSALELLQNGQREGRMILEGQKLPPLPEPSLIRRTAHNQNGRQPWPVFWIKESGVRLVGSSLAPLSHEKKLMIEAVYGEEFCGTDPSYNYLLLPGPVRLAGNWTSVISLWSEGFYHWFSDALPRLSSLGEFSPDTNILLRGPLRAYQRESLRMLGLLDRVRETPEKHLLLEEYYFSSPVGMTGCTNPYSVNWLRAQFLPHRAIIETPRRFFIQRRGKTRGIRNQEEVAEFFKSRGWAVIDLEDLSLAEQIAWFSNAEAIVGEHGAAFTNLLWCRSGCRVLELCADNFLNGCYEGISLCNELQHRFLVLEADSSNRIMVPITMLIKFPIMSDSMQVTGMK